MKGIEILFLLLNPKQESLVILIAGELGSRYYPDSLLLPPISSSQARRLSQV
jgi:hypothetical protein